MTKGGREYQLSAAFSCIRSNYVRIFQAQRKHRSPMGNRRISTMHCPPNTARRLIRRFYLTLVFDCLRLSSCSACRSTQFVLPASDFALTSPPAGRPELFLSHSFSAPFLYSTAFLNVIKVYISAAFGKMTASAKYDAVFPLLLQKPLRLIDRSGFQQLCLPICS